MGFPEFGKREHISDIELFASEIAKCFSCGAISHRHTVCFLFSLKLSQVLVVVVVATRPLPKDGMDRERASCAKSP